MALSGRLIADFSGFVDAVNKTDTSLRAFESNANKVTSSLNKMGDSFSGRAIIQQAVLATKAVEDIGGASMLTAAEQQRLNGILDQAVQKYTALGEKAPQSMLDLQKATQQTADVGKKLAEDFKIDEAIEHPVQAATAAVRTLAEAMGPVGTAALGIVSGLTAAAVAAFELTEKAAGAGEKIQNIYEKTGIAAPALSRLSQAATIAGGDIEQIGNAIFMFDKQIGDSPDKVAKGLSRIGLSIDDIKQMKPEEQFNKIAAALAEMSNTQTRNAAGAEIFGRAAKDLMPLLVNLGDAMTRTNGLSVWTPEQAKQAEEFSMDLNALRLDAAEVALVLGKDLIPAVQALVNLVGSHRGILPDLIGAIEDDTGIKALKEIRLIQLWFDSRKAPAPAGLPTVAPTVGVHGQEGVAKTFQDTTQAAQEQIVQMALLDNHLKSLKATMVPLTVAQQDQASAMLAGGDSAQAVARWLGVSEKSITNFAEATKKSNEELKKFKEADYEASYRTVGLGIFETGGRLKFLDDSLERTNKVFDIHNRILYEITPRYGALHEAVTGVDDVSGNLASTFLDLGLRALPGLNDALGKTGMTTEEARKHLHDLRVEAETAGDKLRQVFGGIAGVLNNISGAFAEVGAMAARAADSIVAGFSDAGSLLQGWIAVAAAVAGIVAKLWPKIKQLFGGPSADELAARELFAKQFGSVQEAIDQVGAAYARMGKSGEEARQDIQRALDATHVSAAAEAAALDIINQKLAEGAARSQAFAAAQSTVVEAATGFNAVAKALEGDRASLQALGRQALTTFAAMVASGKSVTEALTALGPGIDSLVASYQRLGLNIADTGLAALVMQEAILKANPDLIAGIDGLSASMAVLEGLGLVNAASFADMETAGLAMYTRLQAAAAENGGTTRDALLPMQKWLHDAAAEAEKLGIPLDENTQMLIDQSKELGIWKDAAKTGIDLATDAMQELVKVVRELIDVWGQIPTSLPAVPSAPAGAGATQNFDRGGIVLPFPSGGRAGLVTAHVGEMILTPEQQNTIIAGGGGGPIEITLINKLDGVETSRSVTRIQSRDLSLRRKLGSA